MKIPIKIAINKSSYFLNRARDSCHSPPLDQNRNNTPNSQDNYFSPLFLDAYIMSVTALEAFINERIATYLQTVSSRIAMKCAESTEKNSKAILEILLEQELVMKYRMIPIILWQKYFDESRSPFQEFKALVHIRNDIIHYKMPFYDKQNEKPKWARKLEEKHILLPQPIQPDRRVWIDEICTLKGAKWSYNTSCRMIKKFIELSEGIIKATCQYYLNSLQEL